jgi:hypothetical protein
MWPRRKAMWSKEKKIETHSIVRRIGLWEGTRHCRDEVAMDPE